MDKWLEKPISGHFPKSQQLFLRDGEFRERLPPDKTTAGGPPNIHLHSRGQSPTFVRSLHLVYAIESRLIPNQGTSWLKSVMVATLSMKMFDWGICIWPDFGQWQQSQRSAFERAVKVMVLVPLFMGQEVVSQMPSFLGLTIVGSTAPLLPWPRHSHSSSIWVKEGWREQQAGAPSNNV